MLVVDHNSKFTIALFKEFTCSTCSSLLIGSAYYKTWDTNAKAEGAELVNGVLGNTLLAFANSSKNDF